MYIQGAAEKIKHPRLDAIEIDPDRIEIERQDNGIHAFGDLTLSVKDYRVNGAGNA